MHVGWDRRPAWASIRKHHYGIIDTNFGVHELTGGVGKSAKFNRIKDASYLSGRNGIM